MAATAKNDPAFPIWATSWPTDAVGRLLEVEVALSGGIDSVVLLHGLWCFARAHNAPLRAVHVHHGISEYADAWAQFCVRLCEKYAITLRVERVHVARHANNGLEAAARAARYAVFAQSPAPIVALAHHADDQNETFLLAALRGGGLRSMAAMPVFRALRPNLTLWRPLLSCSRTTLSQYAQHHDLQWVEDDSNSNTAYLRNALRHNILPLLHAHVPHLSAQLHASIGQLQTDLALLDEWTAADAATLCDERRRWRVSRWRQLSPNRRMAQLHFLARTHQLGQARAASIANFAHTLAHAQSGQWQLPHGLVVYYRDCLFIQEQATACIEQILNTGYLKTLTGPLANHPHCGNENKSLNQNYNIIQPSPNHPPHWRLPRPKEKVVLAQGGRKPLRHILAQIGVPPTLRDIWPVWDDGKTALPAHYLPTPHLPALRAFQMEDLAADHD